jgi:putative addiction module component (TIGR02574 family)
MLTAGTKRWRRSAIALLLQAVYPQDMEVLTPAEIARMSPPERLALIAELWNSLDEQPLPMSDAHRVELRSRLDSLEQDRTQVVAWADLQAELAARCP